MSGRSDPPVVFNGPPMPRKLITIGAVASAVLATAPSASAAIQEVGLADAQPSCPGEPCYAMTRTTGYQAKVGPNRAAYVVPRNGRIVAWTVRLAKPSTKQTSFFDKTYGGAARAGIAVLRPGKRLYGRLVGRSPTIGLTKYLGAAVQVPLTRTIGVRKGDIVALSVPTWAPVLAVGLGNDTSWRAARPGGKCSDNKTLTVQSTVGTRAQYRCLNRTARLTYSATLISSPGSDTPPAPKPEPKTP